MRRITGYRMAAATVLAIGSSVVSAAWVRADEPAVKPTAETTQPETVLRDYLAAVMARDLDRVLIEWRSLASIAVKRDNWKQGTIEHGRVGGVEFARARWTGVSKPTTLRQYSGKPMRGSSGIAGTKGYVMMSQDVEPEHRTTLKETETAALTIRLEDGDSTPTKAKP